MIDCARVKKFMSMDEGAVGVEVLLKEVVYGGKTDCNNLDYYYNQITSEYLNY